MILPESYATCRILMRQPAADTRRTILVRLSEVPLDVRMRAAARLCKDEHPDERPAIFLAALRPRPEHDWHWVAP